MEYEVVQQHEYQDIYRLKYGVLIIVNKYKSTDYRWYWADTNKYKKQLLKVSGLKNCFKTNEEIKYHNHFKDSDDIIPIGSIIFDNMVVEPTKDRNEYFYELKTTGSCFCGVGQEFVDLLELAKKIYQL